MDKTKEIEEIAAIFGEQETNLIGKKVRTLVDGGAYFKAGDVGTVVLVDDTAGIWVDFGPDGFKGHDGQSSPIWTIAGVGDEGTDFEFVEGAS